MPPVSAGGSTSGESSAQAYDLLASVLDRFTEGFDTADLMTAKTLLDELAGAPK